MTRPWAPEIQRLITEFVKSPSNTLGRVPHEPAWMLPLIGFAAGDDPLFQEIKQSIGPFYWTPRDAMRASGPDLADGPLTVVSWVLPQTEATKAENRRQTRMPSERWAQARGPGEAFNDALHDHVVRELTAQGLPTIAPTHLEAWTVQDAPEVGAASCWSHRHAAFVAGLGTFGLCEGLITPAGKAMRCGSVIVGTEIPPTSRPYSDRHAYCLHYMKGRCCACMKRCPIGAITPTGHDKRACHEYIYGETARSIREAYGLETNGCGLCQTRVPCESSIPPALRVEE